MNFRRLTTLLAFAALGGALVFLLAGKTTESPSQPALAKKAPLPSGQPSSPIISSAGYEVIATVHTTDKEATDAFLKRLAVSPEHLKGMEEENAFITRRQLVRMPANFGDLAKKVYSERPARIQVPDFDGQTIDMDVRYDLNQDFGPTGGYLSGDVPNQEFGDVILSYCNNESTAFINMPSLNRQMEFEPHGDRMIVLKEIDSRARNIAQPCSQNCPTVGTMAAAESAPSADSKTAAQ